MSKASDKIKAAYGLKPREHELRGRVGGATPTSGRGDLGDDKDGGEVGGGAPDRLGIFVWLEKHKDRVFYDDAGGCYWRWHKDAGWISYNEGQFRRLLKFDGYQGNTAKHETASQVESIMVRIQHERRLEFAGSIAGYCPGVHEICGQKILIPRGPKLPRPKRGPWPTLRGFFGDLLKEDARYLYAWLKAAAASLEAGFPWRPGQLLAVAGPAGCGKSLLQNIITEILGGRSCKPYGYLIGETSFNSNYFASEHWMIEDQASSTDIRIRRHFGAMVKNVVVNAVQNFHAKGRDALSVTPFIRMTLSVNDTPDSLLVLPPLEEDILDKIILLRAHPTNTPGEGKGLNARAKFWKQLTDEIPAFLSAMSRWEVPRELIDRRYGVRAYQNEELMEMVSALSQERRLLNLIDTCGFWKDWPVGWKGTAFELETLLREVKAAQGEVSRLMPYHTLCGLFLVRLARSHPKRVRAIHGEQRSNVYELTPPTWE